MFSLTFNMLLYYLVKRKDAKLSKIVQDGAAKLGQELR